MEVRPERKISISMKNLVLYSRKRAGKTMADKLSAEILDAYNQQGAAFKRKEEIMEALLAQTTPAFPQTIPQTLEELDALLRHIEQVQEDYAFYFRDHAQLGQLSQEIRAKQQGVYRRQSAFFCQMFRSLAQEGLVQPEAYPGAYRRSADTLHLTAVYWLPFATLKERDEGFRCQAWAILFPLLTPEGQTACRERAALF